MRANRDTLAKLIGALTVIAVGCAPAESDSHPAPAIVAAATIPPLEVHVERPEPRAEAAIPPGRVAATTTPADTTAEGPATTSESIAAAPPTAVEPTESYEPPFPHRTELFVPPKRAGGAASSQSSSDNAVLLLGFVRVDIPKAVLSINGEIAPMAAGESRYGVDVISIAPPNVVLQRGRQRWQTTLE